MYRDSKIIHILAGLAPSQTSTMLVDGRLYRFYNTLSAFTKGLTLNKFEKETKSQNQYESQIFILRNKILSNVLPCVC